MINEWRGTLTLTEASSRELMRILKKQDIEFMDALFNSKCGFTLECADGRSVELVPRADRPKGEWIMHIDDLFPCESMQECSICHAKQLINGNDDNYCPNCGADMRGREGE